MVIYDGKAFISDDAKVVDMKGVETVLSIEDKDRIVNDTITIDDDESYIRENRDLSALTVVTVDSIIKDFDDSCLLGLELDCTHFSEMMKVVEKGMSCMKDFCGNNYSPTVEEVRMWGTFFSRDISYTEYSFITMVVEAYSEEIEENGLKSVVIDFKGGNYDISDYGSWVGGEFGIFNDDMFLDDNDLYLEINKIKGCCDDLKEKGLPIKGIVVNKGNVSEPVIGVRLPNSKYDRGMYDYMVDYSDGESSDQYVLCVYLP